MFPTRLSRMLGHRFSRIDEETLCLLIFSKLWNYFFLFRRATRFHRDPCGTFFHLYTHTHTHTHIYICLCHSRTRTPYKISCIIYKREEIKINYIFQSKATAFIHSERSRLLLPTKDSKSVRFKRRVMQFLLKHDFPNISNI